jgi:hypothetical protein
LNRHIYRLLALTLAVWLAASAVPAFGQSAGPKLETLIAPASTFGDGWKEMERKIDPTKAEIGYGPAGSTAPKGGPPAPPMAMVMIQNYPSTDKLDADYGLIAVMVAAFSEQAKVEPATQVGDRGIKVVMPPDPKAPGPPAYLVGYIWTFGSTTLVVTAGAATTQADADALATKGADAEKTLLGGATPPPSAPPKKPVPTPAAATGHTQDEAKSWSIGVDAFPKGWQLDKVNPSSGSIPGGEYDAVYVPTDPTSKIIMAEVDVLIPNDTGSMDKVLTQALTGARGAGWAANPSNYYGDRMGFSGVLGTADKAGYIYVYAVDDTLVAVIVVAKPDGADDAADLADQLATAQEAALQ